MKGEPVDRIPVAPKIWLDFSARVTGVDLKDVIRDPLTALRVIAIAGKQLHLDSVRQFQFPAKDIIEEDGSVFELDSGGRKIGKIDMDGGLATHLFDSTDYKIDDPRTIACCHSWITSEPVVNSIEDAKKIAIPDAAVFDDLGWGKRQKAVLDEFGNDFCLVGDCDSATMSFYIAFRGVNNAMLDLITQPELVHTIMKKGVHTAIARGKYWLDLGINVLRLNDSAGNMSLISPQHWREFVFPYIKTVCDQLHSYNADALVYCHICGNVLPVIDQMVEAGLDCIGPLDPLGGFTVKQARQKVGEKVSLLGGVNTLTLLNKTPQEVKHEAFQCINGAGKRGGYILSSGCVVPRNCPSESIIALVEASQAIDLPKMP